MATSAHHKSVVILIGWLLADHVLLGDEDAQAHRLALKVDGVASGEVAAPAATQTFLVRELL